MAKETSIWGDLDLKAVARDVESQTGSLADEVKHSSVAGEVQVPEDAAIVTVESAPQSGEATTAQTAPVGTGAEAAPVAPQIVAAAAARRRVPPRNKGRQTAGPKQRPILSTVETPARTSSQAQVIPIDLVALEDENHRLKALLREKLLSENARLREMLSQFS